MESKNPYTNEITEDITKFFDRIHELAVVYNYECVSSWLKADMIKEIASKYATKIKNDNPDKDINVVYTPVYGSTIIERKKEFGDDEFCEKTAFMFAGISLTKTINGVDDTSSTFVLYNFDTGKRVDRLDKDIPSTYLIETIVNFIRDGFDLGVVDLSMLEAISHLVNDDGFMVVDQSPTTELVSNDCGHGVLFYSSSRFKILYPKFNNTPIKEFEDYVAHDGKTEIEDFLKSLYWPIYVDNHSITVNCIRDKDDESGICRLLVIESYQLNPDGSVNENDPGTFMSIIPTYREDSHE